MIEIFTCSRDVLLFIFQEDACITIIINNLIRLLGYSLTESGYLYASNLYSISMLFCMQVPEGIISNLCAICLPGPMSIIQAVVTLR